MDSLQIQIASMCMCISISATVALGCLFTPKVYLVLFQPEKNVRPGHPNTGGAGGLPGVVQSIGACQSGNRSTHSMRFTGTRSQTMQSVTSCSRSSPIRQQSLASEEITSKAVNGGETPASPYDEETYFS